jgi:hypothetical protein
MSIETRTKLATIMRQHNTGLITASEAYHAICDLLASADEVEA